MRWILIIQLMSLPGYVFADRTVLTQSSARSFYDFLPTSGGSNPPTGTDTIGATVVTEIQLQNLSDQPANGTIKFAPGSYFRGQDYPRNDFKAVVVLCGSTSYKSVTTSSTAVSETGVSYPTDSVTWTIPANGAILLRGFAIFHSKYGTTLNLDLRVRYNPIFSITVQGNQGAVQGSFSHNLEYPPINYDMCNGFLHPVGGRAIGPMPFDFQSITMPIQQGRAF